MCDSDQIWTNSELKVFDRLDSPAKIQNFLDKLPYRSESIYCCPRSVLRDRRAHCFDGALFAAAAMRRLGHPPKIVSLFSVRDDDHLLAVFRRGSCYGALAKSNCSGLRYREPVYRNLRELVMSYFNDYFNPAGERTLRGWSAPLNLAAHDSLEWMTSDKRLNRIDSLLDRQRRYKILTPGMARCLLPVDRRSLKAGFLGANQAGLYKP